MLLYSISKFSSKLVNHQFGRQLLRVAQVKRNHLVKDQSKCFSIASYNLNNMKFTDKHEWIRLDGKIGTVGITDYAQDKLGEVVYVELPGVGTKLVQADQFATLESVKAVSECYSPLSGKVVEVNEPLKETPSHINKSPFEQGWLIKIEVENEADANKLMSETQYREFLKSEEH